MSNVAREPELAEAGGRNPLLIYGAPDATPDLFHAIPAGIVDPFLYAEAGGRRVATASVLDADRVRALGVDVIDPAALGADALLAGGASRYEVELEIALRACRELGLERAIVPPSFPLGVADHLRAGGVALDVDAEAFVLRRRAKTEAQLAGIRRAQKAADAAMAVAAELIRELRPGLTSEEVRAAMAEVCDEHGCDLPGDVIVAHGAQSADGHESGRGALAAGEAVVVDIWPRDRESRCWADMTRTFVAGGGAPDDELAEYWRLTRASLELVYPEVRDGADGNAIFRRSCEPFIEAGQPTQLTKAGRRGPARRLLPRARPRRRARGPRAPGARPLARHAARGRRDHAGARLLPAGLRRRPARGPRRRHRRRLRDADGLPVRPVK